MTDLVKALYEYLAVTDRMPAALEEIANQCRLGTSASSRCRPELVRYLKDLQQRGGSLDNQVAVATAELRHFVCSGSKTERCQCFLVKRTVLLVTDNNLR
jgi:hypothetical protein